MNKIRWAFNYIAAPAFIMLCLICIAVMIAAICIDDVVFTPLTIALTFALIAMILSFLIASRVIRRKELAIENTRYDFEAGASYARGVYVFNDVDTFVAGLCDRAGEMPPERETGEDINTFRFDADGLTIGNRRWQYENMRVRVRTSNYLLRVYAGIAFELTDRYELRLRLSADVLSMIKAFDIVIEDRATLDYILTHKRDAFRQIYNFGRVKRPA